MSDQKVCNLHLDAATRVNFSVGHSWHENESQGSVVVQGSLIGPVDGDYHSHAEKMRGVRCRVVFSSTARWQAQAAKMNDHYGSSNAIGALTIEALAADQSFTYEGETLSTEAIQGWVFVPPPVLSNLLQVLALRTETHVTLSVLVNDARSNVFVSQGELYREGQAGYPLVGYSVSTTLPGGSP